MICPLVHVVDDDASFLRSVSRLLRVSGYKVACYSSVNDFLQRPDPGTPGCVLTDLQMPGRSGLDLQESLARSRHPLPVIFLTAKGDIPTSVRAMRGGAEDFLTKRTPKDQMLGAVERALARDAADRETRARLDHARHRFDGLSERQWQVMRGVVRGLLNKEIADELQIAERTVKHHRTLLMQTLQVQSSAELALLAQEAGVILAAPGAVNAVPRV